MTARAGSDEPGRVARAHLAAPTDPDATAPRAVLAATTRKSSVSASADAAPAKKTAAKKTAAKKTAAKKTAATKSAAGETTASKPVAAKKSSGSKASAAKKAPAKKAAAATTTETSQAKATTAVAAEDLSVREDEDPWTDEQLDEIRQELHAEIARHESQARTVSADLEDLLVSADGGAGDAADVGTSNFERDQELTLAAYAREAITQVRSALHKIEDGTYGRCDSCGQPIGKGRLQAYPRATLCMTCKQREERR